MPGLEGCCCLLQQVQAIWTLEGRGLQNSKCLCCSVDTIKASELHMRVFWLFPWVWPLLLRFLLSHTSRADLPEVPSVLPFSCGAVLYPRSSSASIPCYHLWASPVTLPALPCSPSVPPFLGFAFSFSLALPVLAALHSSVHIPRLRPVLLSLSHCPSLERPPSSVWHCNPLALPVLSAPPASASPSQCPPAWHLPCCSHRGCPHDLFSMIHVLCAVPASWLGWHKITIVCLPGRVLWDEELCSIQMKSVFPEGTSQCAPARAAGAVTWAFPLFGWPVLPSTWKHKVVFLPILEHLKGSVLSHSGSWTSSLVPLLLVLPEPGEKSAVELLDRCFGLAVPRIKSQELKQRLYS